MSRRPNRRSATIARGAGGLANAPSVKTRIGTSAGNDPHEPFTDVLERLTRRGQRSGHFDRSFPAHWLVAATFSLSHVAAERITAGRLTQSKAASFLQQSVLRLYGLPATDALNASWERERM